MTNKGRYLFATNITEDPVMGSFQKSCTSMLSVMRYSYVSSTKDTDDMECEC